MSAIMIHSWSTVETVYRKSFYQEFSPTKQVSVMNFFLEIKFFFALVSSWLCFFYILLIDDSFDRRWSSQQKLKWFGKQLFFVRKNKRILIQIFINNMRFEQVPWVNCFFFLVSHSVARRFATFLLPKWNFSLAHSNKRERKKGARFKLNSKKRKAAMKALRHRAHLCESAWIGKKSMMLISMNRV